MKEDRRYRIIKVTQGKMLHFEIEKTASFLWWTWWRKVRESNTNGSWVFQCDTLEEAKDALEKVKDCYAFIKREEI